MNNNPLSLCDISLKGEQIIQAPFRGLGNFSFRGGNS